MTNLHMPVSGKSDATLDTKVVIAQSVAGDELFGSRNVPAAVSFEFGRDVVPVFDDMVSRSVPRVFDQSLND
jgi:hypothetical protein